MDKSSMDAVRAEACTVLESLTKFKAIIEAYLTLSGVPQTQLGPASGGGVDFVRHMRIGRDLRISTVLRVLKHIAKPVEDESILS